MFVLENFIRKNILDLQAYSSARDEFYGNDGVFLDANENPFGTLNRYPDPYQRDLKAILSEQKAVPVSNIFIGNGSDEVIDLAFRIFCNPGKDKALTFSPTYGMYDVSAAVNNVELIKMPLNTDFQIDIDQLTPFFEDKNLKLIFICSPNNPTGNILENIDYIVQNFNGIVMVDEAYIDFSASKSFVEKIARYSNLIVSQTFSKARGLAAARVGVAFAKEEIITIFNKVKYPYNVSELNQKAALQALENTAAYENQIRIILAQRAWLENELKSIAMITKIYPSEANFLLMETTNADAIYNALVLQKVITRNRNNIIKNCIRITVGLPEENQKLVEVLKSL